jgi:hypothetical protein
MKHRILWPVVGGLGLFALAFAIGSAYAQRIVRGGEGGGGVGVAAFAMPGRFTVAHGSADAVLILDTATGKVYRAGKDDFKKMSELPKINEGLPGVGPRDPDRPIHRERDRKDRDRPRKDREKEREREGDPDRPARD